MFIYYIDRYEHKSFLCRKTAGGYRMSGISGWYDSYEKRFVGEKSVTRTFGEKRYTVVYSGELYNCGELRRELEKREIGRAHV